MKINEIINSGLDHDGDMEFGKTVHAMFNEIIELSREIRMQRTLSRSGLAQIGISDYDVDENTKLLIELDKQFREIISKFESHLIFSKYLTDVSGQNKVRNIAAMMRSTVNDEINKTLKVKLKIKKLREQDIDQLYAHRDELHSVALSLDEQLMMELSEASGYMHDKIEEDALNLLSDIRALRRKVKEEIQSALSLDEEVIDEVDFNNPWNLRSGTPRCSAITQMIRSQGISGLIQVWEKEDDPSQLLATFEHAGSWEVHHFHIDEHGEISSGEKLRQNKTPNVGMIATVKKIYEDHLARGRTVRVTATPQLWRNYSVFINKIVSKSRGNYKVGKPDYNATSADGELCVSQIISHRGKMLNGVKIPESMSGNRLTPSADTIAHKHDVSIEEIESQLRAGLKVELEHTSDRATAREIALDHLNERPDYYSVLSRVGLEESILDEHIGQPWTLVNSGVVAKHIQSDLLSKGIDRLTLKVSAKSDDPNHVIAAYRGNDGCWEVHHFYHSGDGEIKSGQRLSASELETRKNSGGSSGDGYLATAIEIYKSKLSKGYPVRVVASAEMWPIYERIIDRLLHDSSNSYEVKNIDHQYRGLDGNIYVAAKIGHRGKFKIREMPLEEASGYIPSEAQRNDPRFSTALTVDVTPNSISDNVRKLGLGPVARTGVPQTMQGSGKFKRSTKRSTVRSK
jgi:hypothetical protein